MKFELKFPAGYMLTDFDDDNLDMHVLTENGDVYFVTVFTLKNIQKLMEKDQSKYFWCVDSLIVDDLKIETIKIAIENIIKDGYFESILSKIGTIDTIYNQEDDG